MSILPGFIVIDIETTGFDFSKDEIIEIGAVKYSNDQETDKFSLFIKPQNKVPEFIKQLTHITDEQLKNGDDLNSALEKMLAFIKNDILVFHNSRFDLGFINKKLEFTGHPAILNPVLDTLELARIYLPFARNHKLGTLAEYFELEQNQAHRAIFDAEQTARLFLKLQTYIQEEISLQLNFRILEIARYAGSSIVIILEKIVDFQRQNALLSKKIQVKKNTNLNYLCYSPDHPQDYEIEEIFGENGPLDQNFADYELRGEQSEMAQAVFAAFMDQEFLLTEAGTGVGKSLAYLIPALIYANINNVRIIISTNTKNLQEQLFHKDLRIIMRCLQLPLKVTLLKGRRNYLCETKWQEMTLDVEHLFTPEEAGVLLNLLVWREFTGTGDISENSSFHSGRDSSVWKKLAADRLFCKGKRCSNYNRCYLMDIRKKAEKSNLVIINHHLLLADMLADNTAIGKFQHLIIDEAHNLPHLAPGELGLSFSYGDFNNFLNQIFSVRGKFQGGILPTLKAAVTKSRGEQQKYLKTLLDNAIDFLKNRKDIFSECFREIGKTVDKQGSYGKLRVKDLEEFPFLNDYLQKMIIFWQELSEMIQKLRGSISNIASDLFVDQEKHLENLDGVLQRIGEYHDGLTSIYNAELENYAYWLEAISISDDKYPNGIINYAPLNINQLMNDYLYSKLKTAVFTSATLAIRGVFKYFSSRMGLDLLEEGFVRELVVDSPFDFKKHSLVLVSGFLPSPQDRFFAAQSLNVIRQAVATAHTGTMILFTSYKDLNYVYNALSDELYSAGIPLFAQGKGASRALILREFQENDRAVLLGTNSFWEGIDVPGESLSLLILYKLPFLVPTDPIVEAFLEKMKLEGKDSFLHYMLPNALLKFRQGFGRLIRKKTDRGIVLVLDSRIQTKNYGQYFRQIVPADTIITQSPIEIYDHLGQWFRD
ncbi:MAG: 3'-5' exoribonuclease [Candidatus Cloacimonetes bacterium]|nr:3'-5' exoribonuclease [Candidatus Cloacimonadota bacterium]